MKRKMEWGVVWWGVDHLCRYMYVYICIHDFQWHLLYDFGMGGPCSCKVVGWTVRVIILQPLTSPLTQNTMKPQCQHANFTMYLTFLNSSVYLIIHGLQLLNKGIDLVILFCVRLLC